MVNRFYLPMIKFVLSIFIIFLMLLPIFLEAEEILPQRELLLIQDIPVVVTPSRIAQSMLESPSAITVLTAEDIKRYGITSFADIMRNVPGVDVMSVSPTDKNISIRGFNSLGSGRILSLLNGRPMYVDFYGITTWELLPVSIDEIQQIEIMRGPGSALYGANAFDGVINIITNTPIQNEIKSFNVKINQAKEINGNLIHGGRKGKIGYKSSLSWERLSRWNNEYAGENKRLNGFLRYDLDDKSALSIFGIMRSHSGDIAIFPRVSSANHRGTSFDFDLNYVRSGLKFQATWRKLNNLAESKNVLSYNQNSEDSASLSGVIRSEFQSYSIDNNTFESEIQHSFNITKRDFMTWGLNYRFISMDSNLLDAYHSQNIIATYIQEQMKLFRSLSLTAGLRYDRHPLTGNNISPRGSIVYTPGIGHAFRASAGKAFRNPPFVYSYLSTVYSISSPITPKPFAVKLLGNKELSPEEITSFELGYQGMLNSGIKGGIDLFYNKVYGLIDRVYLETYKKDALYPGSPGGIIPSVATLSNAHDAIARGVEIFGDFPVNPWMTAYLNYSYQYVTNAKTEERIESAPMHKLNHGVFVKLGRGFMFNVSGNYVDKTVWEGIDMEPCLLINSSINYKRGRFDFTLSASNLLNKHHLDYPTGEEIGRYIIASMILRME